MATQYARLSEEIPVETTTVQIETAENAENEKPEMMTNSSVGNETAPVAGDAGDLKIDDKFEPVEIAVTKNSIEETESNAEEKEIIEGTPVIAEIPKSDEKPSDLEEPKSIPAAQNTEISEQEPEVEIQQKKSSDVADETLVIREPDSSNIKEEKKTEIENYDTEEAVEVNVVVEIKEESNKTLQEEKKSEMSIEDKVDKVDPVEIVESKCILDENIPSEPVIEQNRDNDTSVVAVPVNEAPVKECHLTEVEVIPLDPTSAEDISETKEPPAAVLPTVMEEIKLRPNAAALAENNANRDSYQATKEEIEDSLQFIKAKLHPTEPELSPEAPKKAKRASKEIKTVTETTVEMNNMSEEETRSPFTKPRNKECANTPDNLGESSAAAGGATVVERMAGDCIPPVRPERVKRQSARLDIPDWQPPKNNLFSYIFGCFSSKSAD